MLSVNTHRDNATFQITRLARVPNPPQTAWVVGKSQMGMSLIQRQAVRALLCHILSLRATTQLQSGSQKTSQLPDTSSSQLGHSDSSQLLECSCTTLGLCLAQDYVWSEVAICFHYIEKLQLICVSVHPENKDKRSFLLSLSVLRQNTLNLGCTLHMKPRLLMAWLS